MTGDQETRTGFHTMRWDDKPTAVGEGGRTLHVDLHTDLDNTRRANSYLLPGYNSDQQSRVQDGFMHPDWIAGRTDTNIIYLTNPEVDLRSVRAGSNLHVGEQVDFRSGEGTPGMYRGIEGVFVCVSPALSGCHIRRQHDDETTLVMGVFEFRPNPDQREHYQAPMGTIRSTAGDVVFTLIDGSQGRTGADYRNNIRANLNDREKATIHDPIPSRWGDGGKAGVMITATEAGRQNADPDYLAFGTWRIVPDDGHGAYEAGAFADGNDPFNVANVRALTGTANYTGEAFGRYGRTMNTDGVTRDGTFQAEANLTANFDNPAPWGSISGNIRNFRLDGSTDSQAWRLELEEADIGRQTPVDSPTGPNNAFESDTSGFADGHAISGRWGGRFFGNPRDDYGVLLDADNDGMIDGNSAGHTRAALVGGVQVDRLDSDGNPVPVVGTERAHPGSVAGTFGAAMTGGAADNGYDLNLIGAFGAHKQ